MAYKRTEEYDASVTNALIEHYRESLALLGENPDREGLLNTDRKSVV